MRNELTPTQIANLTYVANGQFGRGMLSGGTIRALVARGLIVDDTAECTAMWEACSDAEKQSTQICGVPGTECSYRLFYPFTLTEDGAKILGFAGVFIGE